MSGAVILGARRTSRQAVVPVEHLVSLVARGTARARCPELGFVDPCAEAMLSELEGVDVDVCEAHVRASLLGTMVIDGIVRDFFARHPRGVAVALYPGLCSRFSRVDNGTLQWVDIDTPEIATLQCALQRTPPRHAIASGCGLCCSGWLDAIGGDPSPTLIVHQGAARAPAAFADHFEAVVSRIRPGTEYVLDYDARLPIRPSTLAPGRASVELAIADGGVLRYPRAKWVAPDAYPASLRDEVEGLNGVSRLLHGAVVPSVAHVRFV